MLLSLDWDNAFISIQPDGTHIVKVSSNMETPINRLEKISTRQLIILLKEEDVLDAYVLDVVASEKFQRTATSSLRDKSGERLVLPGGFSGEKITYDLGLRMQERLFFKNGELSRRDVLKEESKGGVGVQGGDTQVQQCTAWYLYTTYFYSDGTSHTEKQYLGTTCEGGYECMPNVISGDGEAIGVNCGGNSGGGESYDEPTPAPVRDIIDEFKTLCFKNVLIDLKNSGLTNKVSDALLKIFNSGDKVNLIFAEDPNLGNGKYADNIILLDKRTEGGYLDIQITLNSNYLSQASTEIIAETMIHEILHAYLDATNFQRDQISQHKEMGERYVDWTYQAMRELFPNMPSNDIYALAISGLGQLDKEDPIYVNDLIQSYNLTRSSILGISEAYRNGEKGTKCN